ncbi:hypothetical protein VBZ51_12960 [Maribacter sp. HS]|uniref:hypothetical protein n=1 Tax=Maribacter sp. HS TaxID=3110480 RepID=UPI003A850A3F
MKQTFFLISILIATNLYGQELTKKVGSIEIELIGHQYLRNDDFELTKKKTNKKNRPFEKIYLDSNGIVIKKVTFGKHHNTDLRLTDKIKIYQYNNEQLEEIVLYESDYEKNVYPFSKTELTYGTTGKLTDSTTYSITDNSSHKINFEYDENSNKTKTILYPDYYYERNFDSINRLKSFKQIFENKLRWEWTYAYTEKQRIGTFRTHYNDGEDYTKLEIVSYNEKGNRIEIEEKQVSRDGLNEKTKFFFHPNGLLQKIEKYQSYSNSEEYGLNSFTDIKLKTKINLDDGTIKRINDVIVTK